MLTALRDAVAMISDFINEVVKKVAIVLVAALVIVVLAQVFFRYVLQIGLGWADELSRYLNVWVDMLGASIGFKYGDHVEIEFFRSMLPEKCRRIAKFITRLVMLAFLSVVVYYTFMYFYRSRTITPAMQIPYKWPQSSLFAGYAIIVIHLISFIINDIHDFVHGVFTHGTSEDPNLRKGVPQ